MTDSLWTAALDGAIKFTVLMGILKVCGWLWGRILAGARSIMRWL